MNRQDAKNEPRRDSPGRREEFARAVEYVARGLAVAAVIVLLAALLWPSLGGAVGWGSLAILTGSLVWIILDTAFPRRGP